MKKTTPGKSLPVVQTDAQIEGHIAKLVNTSTSRRKRVQVGPIARLPNGSVVHIAGRLVLKDFWSTHVVRWTCKLRSNATPPKTIRGYHAIQLSKLPLIVHLPVVK